MVERADIDALLEDADDQLELIREMYEETLREQEVPRKLMTRIKNVVENQRSALEYLAHQLYENHGDGKGEKSYFPVATQPTQFGGLFERMLPGVAANCPNVRDAIEARQPYQEGYEWLQHLVLLTNENKHRRLTPQTRSEERRVRVDTPGGGSVEWGPGVTFGSGVSIGGVPVDPATQRPVPSPTQTVTETTYVDWLFEEPPLSALNTLEGIQKELPQLVEDVLGTLP
jgi:hypothetical protein